MPPYVLPLGLGVASGAVLRHFGVHPVLADASAALSFGGSVAAIATTMLGFMLAALAVLASINHTHLVQMMRTTGHYRDLLLTIFTGCIIFLACGIAGFALLFGAPPCRWFMVALVGLHVSALVSLLEIGRKFWLVLTNLRGGE